MHRIALTTEAASKWTPKRIRGTAGSNDPGHLFRASFAGISSPVVAQTAARQTRPVSNPAAPDSALNSKDSVGTGDSTPGVTQHAIAILGKGEKTDSSIAKAHKGKGSDDPDASAPQTTPDATGSHVSETPTNVSVMTGAATVSVTLPAAPATAQTVLAGANVQPKKSKPTSPVLVGSQPPPATPMHSDSDESEPVSCQTDSAPPAGLNPALDPRPHGSVPIQSASTLSVELAAVPLLAATIATLHGPSNSPLRNVAGPSDTFLGADAAMPPTHALPGYTAMQATPNVLEIGLNNGTLGWVQVRAERNVLGQLDATVTASTFAGTEALRHDLPALNSFLLSESVDLSTVTVTQAASILTEPGHNLGTSTSNAPQGEGQQHESQQQSTPGTARLPAEGDPVGQQTLLPASIELLPYARGAGSWLSVRA